MKNSEDKFYFDDFNVGQQFTTDSFKLEKDYAIAFARQYDPQYFHIDETAAKEGIWGGLVASGWHTTAISMRLKLTTPLGKMAGGLVGLGVESMRWPAPVYPGDTLRVVITIAEKRISKSNPKKGIIKYKVETLNQHDKPVLEMLTAVLAPVK